MKTITENKVLLELFRNRYQAIANEMAATILHTASTVFIKETGDFAALLLTSKGEVLACPLRRADKRIGMFLAGEAIEVTKDAEEGDVFISNDPEGTKGLATHLSDVYIWKPYFYNGELFGYGLTFCHVADIGGGVPASILPSNNEVFQEGIVIPPMKLFSKGALRRDVINLIERNTRTPKRTLGDFKALVAGLNTTETRMKGMIEKYGFSTIKETMEPLLGYAELQARELVGEIPDGEYSFADYLETIDKGLIRIKLRMRVKGSDIYLDFSETDPQIDAALNLATHSVDGHWNLVRAFIDYFRTLNPNITYNNGLTRPIHLVPPIPKGSLLNPEPTVAFGTRAATFFKVYDIVWGCLAQAVPEKAIACGAGQAGILAMAKMNLISGERQISTVEPVFGGSGARPMKDGIDAVDWIGAYLRNIPVESVEGELPILIEKYILRKDSGGAGKFRGGTGVELSIKMLASGLSATCRCLDRQTFGPWGLKGGREGATGYTAVESNGKKINTGIIDILYFNEGDVLHFGTQGGGGYGDPLDRDPEAVLFDVKEGKESIKKARELYGVVIENDCLNLEKTYKVREEIKKVREELPFFSFSKARLEYEKIWTEEIQDTLNKALYNNFPASYLRPARSEILKGLRQRIEENKPISKEIILSKIAEMKKKLTSP